MPDALKISTKPSATREYITPFQKAVERDLHRENQLVGHSRPPWLGVCTRSVRGVYGM